MKVKLSEVQSAVMDELQQGAQTVDELKRETGRRVTWSTMTRLRKLGLVDRQFGISGGVVWFLTEHAYAADRVRSPGAPE